MQETVTRPPACRRVATPTPAAPAFGAIRSQIKVRSVFSAPSPFRDGSPLDSMDAGLCLCSMLAPASIFCSPPPRGPLAIWRILLQFCFGCDLAYAGLGCSGGVAGNLLVLGCGTKWVSSQSVRAIAVALIPAFCHQA